MSQRDRVWDENEVPTQFYNIHRINGMHKNWKAQMLLFQTKRISLRRDKINHRIWIYLFLTFSHSHPTHVWRVGKCVCTYVCVCVWFVLTLRWCVFPHFYEVIVYTVWFMFHFFTHPVSFSFFTTHFPKGGKQENHQTANLPA